MFTYTLLPFEICVIKDVLVVYLPHNDYGTVVIHIHDNTQINRIADNTKVTRDIIGTAVYMCASMYVRCLLERPCVHSWAYTIILDSVHTSGVLFLFPCVPVSDISVLIGLAFQVSHIYRDWIIDYHQLHVHCIGDQTLTS